ncbi:hypothetical protein ABBQ32_010552 [Trebouxia sp. C0010 RCD-2024]
MGIRGDRVGMATKAALEPSQLETHITSLMRASFGRLKKRYLAVGPDAVLTSSRKDNTSSRLHPSLPPSPRRNPQGAATPRKTPKKTPAATPGAALPPVSSANAAPASSSAAVSRTVPVRTAVPVPTTHTASDALAAQSKIDSSSAAPGDGAVAKKKRVAIAADASVRPASTSGELSAAMGLMPAGDSQQPLGAGWNTLRHEQSAGGFTGHRGGWFEGAVETQRNHKMDFTDVACQLIGSAKQ